MSAKGIVPLLCLLLWGQLGFAQARQMFEVATVRPAHGTASEGSWSPPGIGKFEAHNLPLARLIMLAYDIDDNQIAGMAPWLESDLFDVAAKPAAGVALSREELRPLLQSLLRERFHLVAHNETRLVPGYALVVAKGGPRLQPTKGSKFPGYRVNVSDRELNGLNWSMPFLATMLQHPAGRPVVDKTGVSGGFDIKLDFSADSSADATLPSVFTAVQETLGLKLEPQEVPVVFLVIDSVDRTPTEN